MRTCRRTHSPKPRPIGAHLQGKHLPGTYARSANPFSEQTKKCKRGLLLVYRTAQEITPQHKFQPTSKPTSKPTPPGYPRHAAAQVCHQRALPCAQLAVEDGATAGLEQQQPEGGCTSEEDTAVRTAGKRPLESSRERKTASSCLGRTPEGQGGNAAQRAAAY